IGSKGWAQGFGRGRGRARGILDRVRLRLGCAVTTAVRRQNRAVGKWCPGLRPCAGLPLGAPWHVASEDIGVVGEGRKSAGEGREEVDGLDVGVRVFNKKK